MRPIFHIIIQNKTTTFSSCRVLLLKIKVVVLFWIKMWNSVSFFLLNYSYMWYKNRRFPEKLQPTTFFSQIKFWNDKIEDRYHTNIHTKCTKIFWWDKSLTLCLRFLFWALFRYLKFWLKYFCGKKKDQLHKLQKWYVLGGYSV